jgi:chromate transporter
VTASGGANDGGGQPEISAGAYILYFLKLGTWGFGGPIALAGRMQRDLVDELRWVTKRDYDEGLALAQLSPGPLAAQLAIYLGWVRARVIGAILVSIAFVGPSFLMVVALAALYVRFGGLDWIAGAFYGIGAAVIALIGRSSVGLLKKTLRTDRLLWAIGLANAAATILTARELIPLVVAGGVVSVVIRRPPSGIAAVAPLPTLLVTGIKGPASAPVLVKILGYFATAGLFVFGSGLAIVPFLHGGVVEHNAWLTERQFLDAVAVAMITPGPVVITVAFIGYLVGGLAGATLAAIGVFVPCFLIVVLVAPHYRKIVGKGRVKAFVDGVTAGAAGALAGAVVVLGRRTLVDAPTILIALASLAALLKIRKLPEPLLIAIAGAIGIAIKTLRL